MEDHFTTLYRHGATVLTIDDLRVLWKATHANRLRAEVHYAVKTGKLLRLRRGVYALTEKYDRRELANKLIVPSYISLETVLMEAGIIFQYTGALTSIALYPREISVRGEVFQYHRVKEEILSCPIGIARQGHVTMATPERAIGDWIYLGKTPAFDRPEAIDKIRLREVADIYGLASVKKRILNLLPT